MILAPAVDVAVKTYVQTYCYKCLYNNALHLNLRCTDQVFVITVLSFKLISYTNNINRYSLVLNLNEANKY